MGNVLTESQLVEAVARDREHGRTIAFANGCFDLLHVGHVRYLRGAAAEADRLVVAVNDDRSVARLKGRGRPILTAADRAELVSAVRGVSYVVIFGDQTVERLLVLLRPEVHCKGTDYTVDSVPERGVVLSYGGRTAIVGDPKTHASRDLFSRIARASDGERQTPDAGHTSNDEHRTSHGERRTSNE
jgi:rfaE bifunctional protein nucleotidyltransferase chain/domain